MKGYDIVIECFRWREEILLHRLRVLKREREDSHFITRRSKSLA